MKFRYKFLVFVVLLVAMFLAGRCGKSRGNTYTPIVLPSEDVEQLQINPEKHTLTLVSKDKTQTLTLPDRLSTIDVHKDDTIAVTSAQVGLENHPFVGFGVGMNIRPMVGTDVFFWKRLDIGPAVMFPGLRLLPSATLEGFSIGVFASYTVYSNTRITAGVDVQKHILAGLTVRI